VKRNDIGRFAFVSLTAPPDLTTLRIEPRQRAVDDGDTGIHDRPQHRILNASLNRSRFADIR
jgi:hypothetical protein